MNLEEYKLDVRKVREYYIEEIPDEIIHSTTSKDRIYKCQNAWFHLVDVVFEDGFRNGYLPWDALCVMDLMRQGWEETNLSGRLTTREDIDRANGYLDFILEIAGKE